MSQMAKQRHREGLGRSPGGPLLAQLLGGSGRLSHDFTPGWSKEEENLIPRGRFKPTGAKADLSPGSPMMPPTTPARPPPYLSALHLLSLVEGVNTLASGTHHPKPSWPAGPAVRGQGRGSGNPLTALGKRARAKGLSKQRSHGAGGPATRVLSHPAATAGRRFTGNWKMCTSHWLEQSRDLRRKAEGGADRALKVA